MDSKSPGAPSIVRPDQARILRAYGDEFHFHLTAAQTGGSLTIFTDITPPGGGPPPHYHTNEDETFVVLDGRVEFLSDGLWTEVPAGTVVHMPRGKRHAFRNPGDRPLKQLIMTAPSGFEDFIADSALEFSRRGGPDMARLGTIAAGHGIIFDPALATG